MTRAGLGRTAQSPAFNLRELSGAAGDLGVLVPITTALILQNGFNATAVFLTFGLTYIVTGWFYRLPVPVQPLKAMAAIAIAQGLSAQEVSAAGLILGVILLALALTGAGQALARFFPRAVVRGIQAGVGLLLLQTGLRLAFSPSIARDSPDLFFQLGGMSVPAGAGLAAGLALAALVALCVGRSIPVGLVLLVPAVAVGALFTPWAHGPGLAWGPQLPPIGLPDHSVLLTAFVALVIPQLPLTLGNAVVACADTARTYFGDRASRVSHRSLLTTKGLANLMAGLLGGVPICHGAGGLTAHYAFGARTGGATIMLGTVLVVLALSVGAGATTVLAVIPLPALGLLLAIAGAQHTLLARDARPGLDWVVVAAIAGVTLVTTNLALGFGVGFAVYQLARLLPRAQGLRRSPRRARLHDTLLADR